MHLSILVKTGAPTADDFLVPVNVRKGLFERAQMIIDESTGFMYTLTKGNDVIAGHSQLPVGSIYEAAVPTNPATLLGYGTWEAI